MGVPSSRTSSYDSLHTLQKDRRFPIAGQ
ncbi:hypothetical protein EV578_1265 [Streptomyces sp. BK205]|nr:hypothetical protein EV578_1265 [Streptomyces sp. BK205]